MVESQPFSLRKDTKIENFGGKMTHVTLETTSFLEYFLDPFGFRFGDPKRWPFALSKAAIPPPRNRPRSDSFNAPVTADQRESV